MHKIKEHSSPVDSVETEHLIINRNYLDVLSSLGFDCFDSIWQYGGGEPVKNIKARSVICIRFRGHNNERCLYLKRHKPEYIGLRRLLTLLFPKWIVSQGRREFENICDFRKSNFATVVPVVAGEKFFRFFWVESFLITEDFSPFFSLEALLRDKPEFLMGTEGEPRKRILINEIALFARGMHREGFNHRDFNATHILLYYEKGSNIPKIALFDLQRVDRRRGFGFRWMIKSLAELNYTLPDKLFDAKDRIYLFLCYKGKSKLHTWDHLQWFWIKRKTARIKRHTEKMMARREERKKKGL